MNSENRYEFFILLGLYGFIAGLFLGMPIFANIGPFPPDAHPVIFPWANPKFGFHVFFSSFGWLLLCMVVGSLERSPKKSTRLYPKE